MRVIVITANLTLGKPGDLLDLDESEVNVRALIKSGAVELAPEKPRKRASKKAAD